MPGYTRSPAEAMSAHVKTIRHRIATLADHHAEAGLTSIHHHLDKWWLAEAYHQLGNGKAPGIDGVTKAKYGEKLNANLDQLVDRVRSREYKAPPVKRVDIPKGNGETRPPGLPTLEDKVLQKAVVMLIEPVFEREFHDFSHGFRPGHRPHDAVRTLRRAVGGEGLPWVIDLDLRKYFDTIPHQPLREMFRRRIRDGVLNRLILGWLKAGALHEGQMQASDEGTPQGGIISPLLANLYLHEALDEWFVHELQPRLKGRARMVRYADDAVMCFSCQTDAEETLRALHERMAAYGLSLHPEKTRLLDFRPAAAKSDRKAGSFTFLGFCYHWGRSRQGKPTVQVKTAKDRLTSKLKELGQWLRDNRHRGLKEQHAQLSAKLRGHLNYYGVSYNSRSLGRFVWEATRRWRYWLNRRNRKGDWPWKRFQRYLAEHPLPKVCIVHSLFD